MKYSCPGRIQKGLTLIELMIAMLLGIFLIGGVIQIFLSSKQTYRMQENLSRIQESGRFAMHFIEQDVRMSGSIGCNSQSSIINTLTTPVPFLYDFSTAIQGFDATSPTIWTPVINADIISPLGGSDVITIRRSDDQGFTVIAHATPSAGLTLDATATTANLKAAGYLNNLGANNCMTVVVSNCATAAVFQVSAIAGTVLSHNIGGGCEPKNVTAELGTTTFKGGQVFPINTISYYVRKRNPLDPGNQPSLYRRVGANDPQELVEGIENMQILYGVDTNNDNTPDFYEKADSVLLNWPNVVSIRISLLVVSLDDNVAAQPIPYVFNNAPPFTPPDRRIRRVFTSIIALRNRLS